MDTTKTITHLSLCSGYEGIGLGLRRVFPNLREIAYVEREGFPIANLVAKMEEGKLDAAPVFTDVKTFPYRKFRGCVDICSFGFPCQPFSAAGKRQATEDPRHLFPSIARGIKACKPRIVLGENVEGILSCKTGDGEPVLQYVLRELEGMGYQATAGIFSAEEVGAPHQRKRVYILGMANSERSGMRGGGSSQECGDDLKWIQGNEGKRNELRSEVEGCGDSSRGAKELGVSNSQPSGEATGAEQPAEGLAVSGAQGRSRDSREELGNARSSESHRVSDKEWTSFSKTGVTSEELGNAASDGCQDRRSEAFGEVRESQEGRMQEPQRRGDATSELAHYSGERAEAGISGQNERQEGQSEEPDYCSYRWPSRPGEPQYDWEEPRITGQAEPQLGRATNGSTSRVDRLRLLGNGVVPLTAEKAFITLLNRVINEKR